MSVWPRDFFGLFLMLYPSSLSCWDDIVCLGSSLCVDSFFPHASASAHETSFLQNARGVLLGSPVSLFISAPVTACCQRNVLMFGIKILYFLTASAGCSPLNTGSWWFMGNPGAWGSSGGDCCHGDLLPSSLQSLTQAPTWLELPTHFSLVVIPMIGNDVLCPSAAPQRAN